MVNKGEAMKKKNKKIKRRINISHLLIVILGGLIILGLIIFLCSRIFVTSETAVKKAYVKTIKEISQTNGVINEIFDDKIISLINDKSSTQDMSMEIKENTLDTRLNNMGISAQLNKDSKRLMGNLTAAVNYQTTPVFQVEGFTDNQNLLISVPGLYDKIFAMESNNIMKQYSASALGQDTQYNDLQDFSVNVFSKDKQEQGINILGNLKNEFVEIYNGQLERLADKMTYEKLKEKQSVEINNQPVMCKGYNVRAESDDVKAFVMEILKQIRTNKTIHSLVEEYAQIQYESIPIYQLMMEDPSYIVESYYKSLDEAMEKLNTAQFSDTSANVYVYKGVIAKAGARSIYTNGEERFVIQLIGGLTGGKNPAEDFNFFVNLQDDNIMLKFDAVGATDVTDNITTASSTYTLGNGSDDLVLNTALTYNKNDNSFTAQGKLSTPQGSYVALDGKGVVDKNKKMLTVTADDIKLDYNNIFTASMSGSYRVSSLQDKIKAPEGEKVEIFKADANAVKEIKNKIAENINNLALVATDKTEKNVTEDK